MVTLLIMMIIDIIIIIISGIYDSTFSCSAKTVFGNTFFPVVTVMTMIIIALIYIFIHTNHVVNM